MRETTQDSLFGTIGRPAVDSLPVPAVLALKNSMILYANGPFERLTGWDRAEVELKKRWRDMVIGGTTLPGSPPGTRSAAATDERVPRFGRQMIDKTGTTREVFVAATPLTAGGEYAVVTFLEMGNSTKKSPSTDVPVDLFPSFFESSIDPILVFLDGKVVDFNEAARIGLGCGAGDSLLGASAAELSPETQPDGRNSLEKSEEMHVLVLRQGNACFEWMYRCLDGRSLWAEVFLTAVPSRGKTYVFAVSRDITGHKAAERDLHELKECYTTAVENCNDGLLIVQEGRYVHANQEMARILGYSGPEEIRGTKIEDDMHLDDRTAVARMHRRRCSGEDVPSRYEITGTRKDGSPFFAELSVTKTTYGGSLAFLVYMRDTTRRKQVVREQKESERRLRHIFDNAVEGIFQSRLDGRFISINPALARMLAFDSPEQMMREVHDIGSQIYVRSEDRQHLMKIMEKEGIVRDFETELRRRDGGKIWASENVYTVRDDDGRTLYFEGTIIDISERKESEEALRAHEKKLELKSLRLEEANTALRVLLERRDEDLKALENRIEANFKELALPYLRKVKTGHLDEVQSEYLSILEQSLNDIASPFLAKIRETDRSFTPAELQVADLIRSGKSSKEIARLLGITPGTANNHRNNIREKLHLLHRKVNLRTYLLSLQQNVD